MSDEVLDKLKQVVPSDFPEEKLFEPIPKRLWGMSPVDFGSMGPEYLEVAIKVVKKELV